MLIARTIPIFVVFFMAGFLRKKAQESEERVLGGGSGREAYNLTLTVQAYKEHLTREEAPTFVCYPWYGGLC